MRKRSQRKTDPPTVLFYEYEQALLNGKRAVAAQLAKQLTDAGFFVRRLSKHGAGGGA
jgi:hypothetical protein